MKSRKRVEIVRTGTFPLSTGEHTFTKAQLEAAVSNAEGRTAAVLGIGHIDPRWKELGAGFDGEPALGRVEGLELEALDDDQAIVYGDLNDMPDWFADALPSAFPRRSIEGPCDGDDLTITAVKVLGTKLPGVQTLEDLKSFVSDEGPVALAAGADNDGQEVTVLLAAEPTTRLRASANVEDLREAWQSAHPNDYEDDEPTKWWQLVEIQVEPDEVIYKHEGKPFRQSWSVDSDGEFTFGDPTEVVRTYVDKVAASAPGVVFKPPAPSRPTEEVVRVDPKEKRKALGLPEDATDEQYSTKLKELGLSEVTPDAKPGETDPAKPAVEAHPEGEPTEPEKDPAESPADETSPDGTVTVDAETFEGLKVAASRANELYEANEAKERAALLDKAQGEGRFPKARREHYGRMYETDKEGTVKLLTASAADGGLAPGLVPVTGPKGRSDLAASDGASDLLAHTRRALGVKPPKED